MERNDDFESVVNPLISFICVAFSCVMHCVWGTTYKAVLVVQALFMGESTTSFQLALSSSASSSRVSWKVDLSMEILLALFVWNRISPTEGCQRLTKDCLRGGVLGNGKNQPVRYASSPQILKQRVERAAVAARRLRSVTLPYSSGISVALYTAARQ